MSFIAMSVFFAFYGTRGHTILKYSMHPVHVMIPPLFLYAETHFRFFSLFPSLLFKNQPEVVFDAPCRCDPQKDLPIMLIVNDVHRFPAEVMEVLVAVSQKEKPPMAFRFPSPHINIVRHPMESQAMVFVFTIACDKLPRGRIFINCKATLTCRGKTREVLNDNFYSSSKLPFTCFVSDEGLPAHSLCSYGDLHTHSQFSQSHVEFGPPVGVIDLIADTCGLDFLAITDHSYDLACSLENYLEPENVDSRWQALLSEMSMSHKTIAILGEEISSYNSRGKAVHLCGLGLKKFIPGSADGARSNALPTLKLEEAVREIHNQDGLAIAAHPGSKFGFFQRLLLQRGVWLQKDMAGNLDAVQAVNNGFNHSWIESKKLWINELLKGRKLPIVAGNDSHGDFNRYRCIGTPFLSVSENFFRYLSFAKTGIYRKVKSREDVLSSIKSGETFVTSGPFICLSTSELIDDFIIGNTEKRFSGDTITALIISSYEFGIPELIQIFFGQYGSPSERIIFSKRYKENYKIIEKIPVSLLTGKGYLRAETSCLKEDGTRTFAATSPCYI
jgi:predicted metal-dependent phosphoesterase TrpH